MRGGPRRGTSPAHGLSSPPAASAKAPAPTAAPASFPLAAASAPIPAGPAGASARGFAAARAALAVPASVSDAADLDSTAEAAGAEPVMNSMLEEIEAPKPKPEPARPVIPVEEREEVTRERFRRLLEALPPPTGDCTSER